MITKVEIYNYKSIKKDLVLLKRFNVLVGINGSGKSNFIGVLTFVSDALRTSLDQATGKGGGYKSISTRMAGRRAPTIIIKIYLELDSGAEKPDSKEKYHVTYSLTLTNTATPNKEKANCKKEECIVYDQKENILAHLTNNELGVRLKYRDKDYSLELADKDALTLPFMAKVSPELGLTHAFLTSIRSYHINPDEMRAFQDVSSGELQPEGRNAPNTLEEIQQKNQKKYKYICRLLESVVPDISSVDTCSRGSQKALQFHQHFGKHEHDFFGQNISDGTLRILGILLAVHQIKKSSVLIIEEPEATIHPGALNVIIEELQRESRTTQIIISTHSPEILDNKHIPVEAVLNVTKENGVTSIRKISCEDIDVVRKNLATTGDLMRLGSLKSDESQKFLSDDFAEETKEEERQESLTEYLE